MNNKNFYICNHCGNIVEMIQDSGVRPFCCQEEMHLLQANKVDASHEKHIPVVKVTKNAVLVDVGEISHPMTKEHHISWVYLHTQNGGQLKKLDVDAEPKVVFAIDNDVVLAVYAYCNLHGLWVSQL